MRKISTWAIGGLAVTNLAAGLVIAAGATTTAVSAAPLCEGVIESGTVTATIAVGPKCVNYGGATECLTGNEGLPPAVNVWHEVCVPAPIARRSTTS
jgi:hypothetical protein